MAPGSGQFSGSGTLRLGDGRAIPVAFSFESFEMAPMPDVVIPHNPLFLTREEMRELTGLSQPAALVRWLQKNGIEHYVRVDGYPAIPRSIFDRSDSPGPVRQEPNFAALRELPSARSRKKGKP